MLARAKKAPLYLEAMFYPQDDPRYKMFKKELQSRVADICHLTYTADAFFLHRTLKRLASPAPTLEYLSLTNEVYYPCRTPSRATIPDKLFNGTTPRLSCLELRKCNISWKSPFLKGLRNFEIRLPSERVRPNLVDWLDALDEMPQLKQLVLHNASPIASPLPMYIERTVTLPFLTKMDISASVGDCALALSHLVLPALSQLYIKAKSVPGNGPDVQKLLPYITRHSHGPRDTEPLQNLLILSERERMKILAWPDIDARYFDDHGDVDDGILATAPRMSLTVKCRDWLTESFVEDLDAVVAALPLDNLVRLTAHQYSRLDERFWCHHAPQDPARARATGFPCGAWIQRDDTARHWQIPTAPIADKTRPA
jgi:hypothetical protein